MSIYRPFRRIGVAKETPSEENPGGHDQRVILCPTDVGRLVAEGCTVAVQDGAGSALGHRNDDYRAVGATIEPHDALYADKDLIVKYKGPSTENIAAMTPGTTLFCMAHVDVFDIRRETLLKRQINVVTMEAVRGWRKPEPATLVASREIARLFARTTDPSIADQTVAFVGLNQRMEGAFEYLARLGPENLFVIPSLDPRRLARATTTKGLVMVVDSDDQPSVVDALAELEQLRFDVQVLDMAEITDHERDRLVEHYRAANPPPEYGERKIHCLFETGYCGASYGLDLLRIEGCRMQRPGTGTAVVLGYGNVARGALAALVEADVAMSSVMTRRHLVPSRLRPWLSRADLVICGAEQDADLRGQHYYITNSDIAHVLPRGSAVVDLIGGTPNKRCPVEPLVQTTFLPDIHFEQNGVFIAGLWGWDLAGKVEESAATYSRQVTEVLLGEDRMIDGLPSASESVRRALVLGPFEPPLEIGLAA